MNDTSPGEAFLAMNSKTDAELLDIAKRPTNGADEIMARDILRSRMSSGWKRTRHEET